MDIQVVERSESDAVIVLSGRLDLITAPRIKEQLVHATMSGRRCVVDMADVTFVDSSGLGALIAGLKAARVQGGDLRIARPADQMRVILELTTLDRVLRPYSTVEEAMADG